MSRKVLFHISANQYEITSTRHHTFKIWEELSKGFDEYHVFARNKSMKFARAKFGNIYVHLIPSFGKRGLVFFFLSWLLPFYILKYRPSHLLAQCPVMGGIVGAVCSMVFGISLFVELHGKHYFEQARAGVIGRVEHCFYRLLSVFSFRQAKKIRVLSRDMFDKFISVYGVEYSKKTVIIPVRVDLRNFLPKEHYVKRDKLRIVNIGRLCSNKNQIGLLEDLKSFSDCPLEIILIGDGEDLNRIKLFQMELPEHINIRCCGAITHEEIAKILLDCDIYVHYSISEGTPRAILEAMAVGLPVITSDSGFMKDVFMHG